MSEHVVGAHTGLRSDQGARKGEHPGRSVLRPACTSLTPSRHSAQS